MKQRGKKRQKQKHSISELWDNFKQPNVYVIGIPEERAEGETIFEEIMAQIFQIWWKL